MANLATIGILGTGTIGSSWAAFFAAKGCDVSMFDSNPAVLERGLAAARDNIDALEAAGMMPVGEAEPAGARLAAADSVAATASGADYIQESIAETYEAKRAVFAEASAAARDDAVIASSTSGLLITKIQEAASHPERTLIAHPFNPPHLVPLVELVPGEATSPATIEKALAFFERLGKVPVVLKKEVPGHIANRLAAALWRESIDLVASGVATVEDVDKALHAGPGLRWAVMGQHMIYHLGGGEGGYRGFIDRIGGSFESCMADMADWTEIPEDAKDAVVAGVLDEAGGRSLAELRQLRDRKLVAVLKALAATDD